MSQVCVEELVFPAFFFDSTPKRLRMYKHAPTCMSPCRNAVCESSRLNVYFQLFFKLDHMDVYELANTRGG